MVIYSERNNGYQIVLPMFFNFYPVLWIVLLRENFITFVIILSTSKNFIQCREFYLVSNFIQPKEFSESSRKQKKGWKGFMVLKSYGTFL